MSSVAVFVDAGYLFAQGSVALTGAKKPRIALRLNETAALAELNAIAHAKSGNLPLLRVYWYDGSRSSTGLTLEHSTLAHTDYIKLRLGVMNSMGQQKGVDSLIVTDLIELARNHAINDAVLLSGDEDVRVGVSIAQSFGVRLHLIGIAPCRGSQSPALMQEADTTTEWDAAVIGRFLSVVPESHVVIATDPTAPNVVSAPPAALSIDPSTRAAIDVVAISIHTALDSAAITGVRTFWATSNGLPHELDSKLLGRCRSEVGRNMTFEEKRYARRKLSGLIGTASSASAVDS